MVFLWIAGALVFKATMKYNTALARRGGVQAFDSSTPGAEAGGPLRSRPAWFME